MKKVLFNSICIVFLLNLILAKMSFARIKLSALPDRETAIVNLDNPDFTLIEEERILTLQKGNNQIDFSWKAVEIDPDSIILKILSYTDKVRLLSVSYPPNEQALVWNIWSDEAWEEKVRISYLLKNIDRVVAYQATTTKDEKTLDLKSYLILRNFSGEDFDIAKIKLNYGEAFEKSIKHEETKKMLFLEKKELLIEKIFTFDASKTPWEPDKEAKNVGIPVTYKIKNSKENSLGEFILLGGKTRVFQDDGKSSTIFLGEDKTELIPVGEKMELYIGNSRDIVVTQRKIESKENILKNNQNRQSILKNVDEKYKIEIENFKDTPANLTIVEYIPEPGEWEMIETNFNFEKVDYRTIQYEIPIKPKSKEIVNLHYRLLNVR
ncbi:DUF4139 domain-containing protein [Candidatus Desantisbacteria bacterium]|nr:DUF4139 domain-containing protein [Candidatus Desantisbacteria bacterium]